MEELKKKLEEYIKKNNNFELAEEYKRQNTLIKPILEPPIPPLLERYFEIKQKTIKSTALFLENNNLEEYKLNLQSLYEEFSRMIQIKISFEDYFVLVFFCHFNLQAFIQK